MVTQRNAKHSTMYYILVQTESQSLTQLIISILRPTRMDEWLDI